MSLPLPHPLRSVCVCEIADVKAVRGLRYFCDRFPQPKRNVSVPAAAAGFHPSQSFRLFIFPALQMVAVLHFRVSALPFDQGSTRLTIQQAERHPFQYLSPVEAVCYMGSWPTGICAYISLIVHPYLDSKCPQSSAALTD